MESNPKRNRYLVLIYGCLLGKSLKSDEIESLAKRAERVSREVSFPSMLRFLPDRGARLMQVRGMDGGLSFLRDGRDSNQ